VAQGQNLDFEFGPRSEAGSNRRKEANNASTHIGARYQPKTGRLNRYKVYGVFGRDNLAFRDYLRADAEAARQFADLKRVLAARFARDREAFLDAKSVHVQEIVGRARGAA
jgi:GrpB-like predicted nucleotidyltransferase (UPF0157 family)